MRRSEAVRSAMRVWGGLLAMAGMFAVVIGSVAAPAEARDVCKTKNRLASSDAADGRVVVRQRENGRTSVDIGVEDLLPLATYRVFIDGVMRGAITTETNGADIGVGGLDFDSDPGQVADGDADAVLDFDVVPAPGQEISLEIKNPAPDDTVRLSTTSLTCD